MSKLDEVTLVMCAIAGAIGIIGIMIQLGMLNDFLREWASKKRI